MPIYIRNSLYTTQYYCVDQLRFIEPEIEKIKVSDLTAESLKRHNENCLYLSLNPYHYNPVVRKIYPIPPKTAWEYNCGQFKLIQRPYINTTKDYDLNKILQATKLSIKNCKDRIAVELSGGLDTSIIIGILRELDVEPYLIGAESTRFEFRTEKYIQHKLINDPQKTYLFDEKEGLPFADLMHAPVHFLPNKSSLFYQLNIPTLKKAKEFGVNFVLNGIGLDSILIDAVGAPEKNYWYDLSNIDDSWANDHIFYPSGIRYLNVGAVPFVRRMLISLRRGQKQDIQKLWARNYFRNQLPIELVNYSYKASFGGIYYKGLKVAEEEILALTSYAYSITKIPELNPNNMKKLVAQVLSFSNKSEFNLFSLLSYAVWIFQLEKANRISD